MEKSVAEPQLAEPHRAKLQLGINKFEATIVDVG